MKNIRIGNDILLNFPIILENSTIEQIRKMNFKVFVMPSKPDVTESSTPETPADKYKYRICDNHEMYNWKFDEFKKHHKHVCELSHKIVEVEDDKYVFEAYFPAYHQHVLGKYDVIIFGNHKEVGQCVCDQKEFVNLVAHSEDADQVFTEDAEPILVLHPLMIEYGKLNEIEQAEKDRVLAEQYRVNNEINREAAERLRNSEFSNKLNKPKTEGTEGLVLSLNSNGETIWKNEEGGVSEETVNGKIQLVTNYVWDQFLHKSEKDVILNSLEATHNYIVNQVDPLVERNIENIESLTDRIDVAEEEISKIESELGEFVNMVEPYVVKHWKQTTEGVEFTDANECADIVAKKYKQLYVDNMLLDLVGGDDNYVEYEKILAFGTADMLLAFSAHIEKTTGIAKGNDARLGITSSLETEARDLTSAVNEVNSKVTQIGLEVGELDERVEILENTHSAPMISITWAELKVLRDGGQLVAGMQYRITDYTCTTKQENTMSAHHDFDIIVTADDSKTLNENARACLHNGDIYFNDYDAKLEAWKLMYCLDNDTERFAWASAKDSITSLSWGGVYMFAGEMHINGELYYKWEGDGELFTKVRQPNPSVDHLYDDSGFDLTEDGESFDAYNPIGKGVIYRMIDEWNNDVPYDFKNIMFKRTLIEGAYDEDGEETWVYTFNAYLEDDSTFHDATLLNQTPLDDAGCACKNNIIKDYNFGYFDAMYSLLRMNDIVFLNIYSIGTEYYFECHSNIFENNCYSNTFGNSCRNNIFGNGCHSNTFGGWSYYNNLGNNCYSNIFGDYCSHNNFGYYCYSNTFENDCCSNTFGNTCYQNTFGYECHSNIFGDSFRNNTFKNECYFNIFGNDCYSNTFGNECTHNTFGNRCFSNNFGDICYSNTFGSYCRFNTFGSSVNNLMSYARCITLEAGVQCTYIWCGVTTSSSNQCQNVHVNSGVRGIGDGIRKMIKIPTAGNEFLTTIGTANDVTINV